jgi:hypothetical protein
MTASGIPVDVDVLRDEIRKTYTDVSTDHDAEFMFRPGPTWCGRRGSRGRPWRRHGDLSGAGLGAGPAAINARG